MGFSIQKIFLGLSLIAGTLASSSAWPQSFGGEVNLRLGPVEAGVRAGVSGRFDRRSTRVLLPSLGSNPFGLETRPVPNSYFYLGQGAMRSLTLGGWRRVEKIYVQAEGISREGANLEVIANGQSKRVVYVPGRDPNYEIEICETVESIEFRNISGGALTIHQVHVVQSPTLQKSWPVRFGHSHGSMSQALDIAGTAIGLVEAFENSGLVDFADFGFYLLPIKKSAANVYVMGSAYSDLSSKVGQALIALGAQIDFAAPFIDSSLAKGATFDLATELLALRENIRALTQ